MDEIFPLPSVLTSLPLSPPVPTLKPVRPTSTPLPPWNLLLPLQLEAAVPPFKLYYDLFLYAFFGTFYSISLIVNFHLLSPYLQMNSGQ